MEKIKLTVALTTYNRPFYLKQALEAVLEQTYSNFELLIMDNGSDPETAELIRGYNDKRIRYHRNHVNSRDYVNSAWELASGEYLIITHDDDIMKSNMLEEEIRILESFPDVIGVSCNYTSIDAKGNTKKERALPLELPLKINQFEYSYYYLSQSIYIIFPCMMMRKNFFIQNTLKFQLEVGPGADTFLWMKANLMPSSFYILDAPLYMYRIHNKQDSIVNNLELKLSLYQALFGLYLYVNQIKEFNRITSILLNEYVKSYYFKIIDKTEYSNKISDLIIKLNRSNRGKKLIIRAWLYKNFPVVLKTIYKILYT